MRDIAAPLSQYFVLPLSARRNLFMSQQRFDKHFGIEGQLASIQVLCAERLRVMVQYHQAPWCSRGFDTPQLIDTYYWRPTNSTMTVVKWYACA